MNRGEIRLLVYYRMISTQHFSARQTNVNCGFTNKSQT